MLSIARAAVRPRILASSAPLQARLSSSSSSSASNTTHDPTTTTSSSTASQSSDDPTSKQILAAEAAAEADRALTQHRAEGAPVAAAVVSGAPPELTRRPIRIYQVGWTYSLVLALCFSLSFSLPGMLCYANGDRRQTDSRWESITSGEL